jgi:acetyl esterase/lipase
MCIRLNRLTSRTAAIFAVMALSLCWASVGLCLVPSGPAMRPFRMPDGVKILRDIEYARVGDKSLLLDIYMPEKTTGPLPLIVWIHGGAWQVGSKNGCPAVRLVPQGYIAASLNYRLSQEAPFPAQIEDCKGAIRFLRASAAKYSIDPNRIGVWGGSAGGHLVALLGTTGDIKELEGNVGGNLDQSSRVQAVVDFFGPANLGKMLNRFGPAASADANGPVIRLLGPDLKSAREMAPKASPVTYARKENAPFLIVHGDKDLAVPISQSETLRDALKAAGVDVEMHVLKGAGHGFQGADAETANKYVANFFAKQLKGTATSQPAAEGAPPAASGPASRPVAMSPAPATRPAEGPDPD